MFSVFEWVIEQVYFKRDSSTRCFRYQKTSSKLCQIIQSFDKPKVPILIWIVFTIQAKLTGC